MKEYRDLIRNCKPCYYNDLINDIYDILAKDYFRSIIRMMKFLGLNEKECIENKDVENIFVEYYPSRIEEIYDICYIEYDFKFIDRASMNGDVESGECDGKYYILEIGFDMLSNDEISRNHLFIGAMSIHLDTLQDIYHFFVLKMIERKKALRKAKQQSKIR